MYLTGWWTLSSFLWTSKQQTGIVIPGSCPECSDECLENSTEYDEGVLPGGSEVDKWEGDEGVDEETNDDRQHVQPQALHHLPGVLDVQDLPTDQEHDTHWRVPTEQRGHYRRAIHWGGNMVPIGEYLEILVDRRGYCFYTRAEIQWNLVTANTLIMNSYYSKATGLFLHVTSL